MDTKKIKLNITHNYLNYITNEWSKRVGANGRELGNIMHEIQKKGSFPLAKKHKVWGLAGGMSNAFGERGRELFYFFCYYSHYYKNPTYCKKVYDSALESPDHFGHNFNTVLSILKSNGIVTNLKPQKTT